MGNKVHVQKQIYGHSRTFGRPRGLQRPYRRFVPYRQGRGSGNLYTTDQERYQQRYDG